jgi:hypothetical protein
MEQVAQPSYAGRPIKRRVLNLGVGGAIELPAEVAEAAPRSLVTFTVTGRLGSVKHRFEPDGSVIEQVILTIDADTVSVQNVAPSDDDVQLELVEDDD